MTTSAPPRSEVKSPFFSRTFTLVCIAYAGAVETFCRTATGESVATVLPSWLAKGDGRVILSVLWLLATPGVLALVADHIRNVYVSLSGKPESTVFLGDRLREGFYVVQEGQASDPPLFVEHFVARDQYPSLTFHNIYVRRILLRDAEGNLTSAEALSTGKTVIFTLAQLFLLLLSAGPWISIAGQYRSGFTVRADLPQAVGALALPAEIVWGVPILIGALYLCSIAVIAWATRGARGAGGDRVMPLPKIAKEGAVLQATVVATEVFTIDNTKRDFQDSRFYKRYAFRFDGPDFPLPAYLNWSAQRVHEGNLGVTLGKRTQELGQQKEYYDGLFGHLDGAMKSGVPVELEVDEDLAVVPKWGAEGGKDPSRSSRQPVRRAGAASRK